MKRTYIGAYGLCLRDGAMLFTRLAAHVSDRGKWTLPGGGIEWGESPHEAVIRELEEETGLQGAVRGVAGIFSRRYERSSDRPRPSVHHMGILYWIEVTGEELRHEIGGSTDQCAWVPLVEAPQLELVDLARYGLDLVGAGG